MQSSRLIHGLILVLVFLMGGWIVIYFWGASTLVEIRILPKTVMYGCLVYVILQVLKRLVHKRRYWWDWLYYIGLASAILPTFLASSENERILHILTDFGSTFLLIPVLLDALTFF